MLTAPSLPSGEITLDHKMSEGPEAIMDGLGWKGYRWKPSVNIHVRDCRPRRSQDNLHGE